MSTARSSLFALWCVLVGGTAGAQGAPPTTRLITTRDGAHLAVQVVEPKGESSTTFVILHGGPGVTHDYLRPEWDALSVFGRVVYYDQRGCGGSTRRGPYSWQGHVRDLDDLLAEVSPTKPVVLAGSSWGTQLALAYAFYHQRRVSALVLSGVVPWPGLGLPPATATLDSFSRGEGRYPYARNDSVPAASMPLVIRGPRGDSLQRALSVCQHVTLLLTPAKTSMPPLDSLRRISVPTLLIAGDNLTNLPPDGSAGIANVLTRARRVVLLGAGHDPWIENPSQFFREVGAFLDSLPDSTRTKNHEE